MTGPKTRQSPRQPMLRFCVRSLPYGFQAQRAENKNPAPVRDGHSRLKDSRSLKQATAACDFLCFIVGYVKYSSASIIVSRLRAREIFPAHTSFPRTSRTQRAKSLPFL